MAELQTAEFWQDHLEAWKRCGLTQIAYCANNQLHIKSLSRRLSRERAVVQAAKSLTLNPEAVKLVVAKYNKLSSN